MYRIYTAIAIPIIFVTMGSLAFGLWKWLKNKGSGGARVLFIVLSGIFVCLEASKQIYEFCQPDGYRLYSIPLHVCSFFVFFPILASCLKQEGKLSKVFWALSVNSAVIVSIAMLVAPEIIIGLQAEGVLKATGTYLDYHSVIHHTLIVLYAFLAIFFKPWKPDRKDCVGAGCVWGGFLILAWIMANALQTDFSSFLRLGNGFFIQLLVWVLHVICFVLSSVVVLFSAKIYRKRMAKK